MSVCFDGVEHDFGGLPRKAVCDSSGPMLVIHHAHLIRTAKHLHPFPDHLQNRRLRTEGLLADADFSAPNRIQRIGSASDVQKGYRTLWDLLIQPIGAGDRGRCGDERRKLARHLKVMEAPLEKPVA